MGDDVYQTSAADYGESRLGSVIPREIVSWIQTLNLPLPLRYPKRDLANGFLVAEICARYWPQVPLHAVENKLSVKNKQANWDVVRKVFRQKKIPLSDKVVEGIIAGKKAYAEVFLRQLYTLLTGKEVVEAPSLPPPRAPAADVPVFDAETASAAVVGARGQQQQQQQQQQRQLPSHSLSGASASATAAGSQPFGPSSSSSAAAGVNRYAQFASTLQPPPSSAALRESQANTGTLLSGRGAAGAGSVSAGAGAAAAASGNSGRRVSYEARHISHSLANEQLQQQLQQQQQSGNDENNDEDETVSDYQAVRLRLAAQERRRTGSLSYHRPDATVQGGFIPDNPDAAPSPMGFAVSVRAADKASTVVGTSGGFVDMDTYELDPDSPNYQQRLQQQHQQKQQQHGGGGDDGAAAAAAFQGYGSLTAAWAESVLQSRRQAFAAARSEAVPSWPLTPEVPLNVLYFLSQPPAAAATSASPNSSSRGGRNAPGDAAPGSAAGAAAGHSDGDSANATLGPNAGGGEAAAVTAELQEAVWSGFLARAEELAYLALADATVLPDAVKLFLFRTDPRLERGASTRRRSQLANAGERKRRGSSGPFGGGSPASSAALSPGARGDGGNLAGGLDGGDESGARDPRVFAFLSTVLSLMSAINPSYTLPNACAALLDCPSALVELRRATHEAAQGYAAVLAAALSTDAGTARMQLPELLSALYEAITGDATDDTQARASFLVLLRALALNVVRQPPSRAAAAVAANTARARGGDKKGAGGAGAGAGGNGTDAVSAKIAAARRKEAAFNKALFSVAVYNAVAALASSSPAVRLAGTAVAVTLAQIGCPLSTMLHAFLPHFFPEPPAGADDASQQGRHSAQPRGQNASHRAVLEIPGVVADEDNEAAGGDDADMSPGAVALLTQPPLEVYLRTAWLRACAESLASLPPPPPPSASSSSPGSPTTSDPQIRTAMTNIFSAIAEDVAGYLAAPGGHPRAKALTAYELCLAASALPYTRAAAASREYIAARVLRCLSRPAVVAAGATDRMLPPPPPPDGVADSGSGADPSLQWRHPLLGPLRTPELLARCNPLLMCTALLTAFPASSPDGHAGGGGGGSAATRLTARVQALGRDPAGTSGGGSKALPPTAAARVAWLHRICVLGRHREPLPPEELLFDDGSASAPPSAGGFDDSGSSAAGSDLGGRYYGGQRGGAGGGGGSGGGGAHKAPTWAAVQQACYDDLAVVTGGGELVARLPPLPPSASAAARAARTRVLGLAACAKEVVGVWYDQSKSAAGAGGGAMRRPGGVSPSAGARTPDLEEALTWYQQRFGYGGGGSQQ